MAEGTRMKTIEKNIRKLEQLQQQHAITLNQWMESTKSNLEEFHKEIPSFETKIQEHDPITFRSEIPEVRPQIVNANSRSRTFEENLNKMEILAQQHAAMLNLWRNSTNLSFDESGQKLEGQRIPSEDPQAQEQSDNGGSTYMGEILSNQILNPTPRATNLEANSFHGNRTLEQEFLGTPPECIHLEANNRSTSMKQNGSESHQQQEKTFPTLDSEFKENDNLGVGNLELHPSIVEDSAGFKEFKFIVNAHEVFDELPDK